MDSIKHTKASGYLQCCSDILSMISIPSCTTFSFVKIGSSYDMFLSFKEYFIALWKEYGIPEGYSDMNELIDNFSLTFIKEENWRSRLEESLDYWMYPLFDNSKIVDDICTFKVKYITESIISLIQDYFDGRLFDVFTFGKEDEEFIRNSLDYLKSEDFIFRTEDEIYLLHLGLSD